MLEMRKNGGLVKVLPKKQNQEDTERDRFINI
jgi:hypothetical protein